MSFQSWTWIATVHGSSRVRLRRVTKISNIGEKATTLVNCTGRWSGQTITDLCSSLRHSVSNSYRRHVGGTVYCAAIVA